MFGKWNQRSKYGNSLALSGVERLEDRMMLSVVPPTVSDVAVSSSQWNQTFLDYLQASGLGDTGYSIPVGSDAQSTTLPWVDLDQISITFSEDVEVQEYDLSITGVTNTSYGTDHFFYDPQTRVATWTLSTPLATEERVHLDLDGNGVDPVQDLDGNILDGEWVDEVSTYESGNGTAGGDFEFSFNALEGDVHVDPDGFIDDIVDYFDYLYVQYAEGLTTTDPSYKAEYDLNGNGTVDSSDPIVALGNLWATVPTGTPSGASNDAPTTTGFDLEFITDRVADTNVSLDDVFDDFETADSAFSYTIKSQTNAGLFDTAAINSSTGELTLNAAATGSGRSEMIIAATDASGLAVEAPLTIDIDYVNQPPAISDYLGVFLPGYVLEITGTVSDPDDDVEGFIVQLSGVFEARVVVRDDGSFIYQRILLPGNAGWEFATTWDQHGAQSLSPVIYVGLT